MIVDRMAPRECMQMKTTLSPRTSMAAPKVSNA